MDQLLVQSSCQIKFSLTRVDSLGPYETVEVLGLVSILGILVVLLYWEVMDAAVSGNEVSLPEGVGEMLIG